MFFPFSSFYSLSSFWSSAARKEKHQCEAGGEHRQTHQLRRGEAGMNVVGRIIAAKGFGDGAEDRVNYQVSRKNLAVQFFAAEQPREKTVENQIQQRVVNSCRMHRRAVRFVVGRKMDCPRQIARATVATAVQQTADAPENTAQRDEIGRAHVRTPVPP